MERRGTDERAAVCRNEYGIPPPIIGTSSFPHIVAREAQDLCEYAFANIVDAISADDLGQGFYIC
jgi:hypothetical protein